MSVFQSNLTLLWQNKALALIDGALVVRMPDLQGTEGQCYAEFVGVATMNSTGYKSLSFGTLVC